MPNAVSLAVIANRFDAWQRATSRRCSAVHKWSRKQSLAERIFGSREKAEQWLNNPNPHFDGKRPIQSLRSALGEL
jgi:uncharacterized protein (DUF2384 family)